MRVRLVVWFVLSVVVLAGCGISGAPSAAAPAAAPLSAAAEDLTNPPEIASRGGVADVAIAAAVNPVTGGPGIEYQGAFVPPTIRVSPGDTIRVSYENQLPASSAEPLNMASLHFHGLSVSPNPPSDDSIDLMAMPGQTLHYVIHVPASQPPGLYWYHSHSHGEADWQLSNGMSAALVVQGTAALSPAVAGLPERVIVLRNVLAHPAFTSLAKLRSSGTHGLASAVAQPTPAPAVCQGPFDVPSEHTTIDDRNAGTTLLMQPGKKQFWRILNASSNGFYDLHLDGSSFHVVSRDGVPLRTYPGAAEEEEPDLKIPPAGRVEAIVTGTAAGAALHTSCTDTGPGGDPNPPQILALVRTGTPAAPAVPAAGATPRAHGTYDEALGSPVTQRSLAFSESSDGETFYLNGAVYSPTSAPMFIVQSGTVERWTLTNSSDELHVFHMHQLHFVVQDIDGTPQPAHWNDTVVLPYRHADGTPSTTHVLLNFRDPIIRGTFLFHCHLLEHEDGGMMAKIAVE